MPMILFRCNNPDCDNQITKVLKLKDIPPFLDCGQCGTGKLERQLGAPSQNKTEVVDNGIQARQTEIMSEVIEKERKRLYNGD